MTNIGIGKWQKIKNSYASKDKITLQKGGIGVCLRPACKPHTEQGDHSCKLNAHVLGIMMLVRHPDPKS